MTRNRLVSAMQTHTRFDTLAPHFQKVLSVSMTDEEGQRWISNRDLANLLSNPDKMEMLNAQQAELMFELDQLKRRAEATRDTHEVWQR